MEKRRVIFADPFGGKAELRAAPPEDARLACAYELFVQFEWFTEAAFLRRTQATDELWLGEGGVVVNGKDCAEGSVPADLDRFRCAVIARRAGDELSSCLDLLEILLRARHDFCSPAGFIAPGIVDEATYEGLVERLERSVEQNKGRAREAETEIIRVAREAGLQPEPSGDARGCWYATCPEKNHHLLIDAESNTFGCGYCRRKGSAADLRALALERRARRSDAREEDGGHGAQVDPQ